LFSTTSFIAEPAPSAKAAKWMLRADDAHAQSFRRLMLRPAEYCHAGRLPNDLPPAFMARLAANPRTARLVSATLLRTSSQPDLQTVQAESPTLRLAMLEGEILLLLARMIGLTWVAPTLVQCIDGEQVRPLAESMGPELWRFAQEAAPLLGVGDALPIDLAPEAKPMLAIEGVGYRTLIDTIADTAPWIQHRFRLKCPDPLDTRIALESVSSATKLAVAVRVARQLPPPWSTSFLPRTA
jgi:hypothetical protein